jgi:hypothetical protein
MAQNPASKYDYGTDQEEEKGEGQQPSSPIVVDEDGLQTVKIKQTEISQDDFNNFLHKCTLNLPP